MSLLQLARAATGALVVSLVAVSLPAQQHQHHADSTRVDSAKKEARPSVLMRDSALTPILMTPHDTMHHAPDSMPDMAEMHGMAMMTGALGISTERMGSGTTWIPDAVSLPSRHIPARGWDVMVHGFIFGQYDAQRGPRGDHQIGSLNWAMLMASREIGGGMFQARTMLSVDPATVGGRGYPLLLQSGEMYRGEPLHDRQHPHDFLMELGVLYERPFARDVAWSLYAAPSGEPALGPVAFMHRPSAMDIPTANLTHHWQDATHISFGVLTAGLFTRRAKLEGSVFNGREPDDRRWNIDPIHLDSYSARVTINPTENWSAAVGFGYLKSPEALRPEESMHRVTASILHGMKLGRDGQWSSAFIWGANRHSGRAATTHGALLESDAVLDARNTLIARAEYVQKSAEDLALDGPVPFSLPGSATFDPERVFDVSALSLGYIREVGRWAWATIGVGAQGTVNVVPGALESVYGSRAPLGGLLFLRLRPFHTVMSEMAPMGTSNRGGSAGYDR
ncbi:MAG: hypothetical protein ACR2OG_05955 [Gemmatimonadaceae bacterium]